MVAQPIKWLLSKMRSLMAFKIASILLVLHQSQDKVDKENSSRNTNYWKTRIRFFWWSSKTFPDFVLWQEHIKMKFSIYSCLLLAETNYRYQMVLCRGSSWDIPLWDFPYGICDFGNPNPIWDFFVNPIGIFLDFFLIKMTFLR